MIGAAESEYSRNHPNRKTDDSEAQGSLPLGHAGDSKPHGWPLENVKHSSWQAFLRR
jgi:hypothetical protein